MALKFGKPTVLPKSLGKGGGRTNEALNAIADEILADGNEAADSLEAGQSIRLTGFGDLTPGQIAAKVNASVLANQSNYRFYLVAKNVDENGKECVIERTVKERGTGADKVVVSAGALFLVPGVKPVQTRERGKSDATDDESEAAA